MALTTIKISFKANILNMNDDQTIDMIEKWAEQNAGIESWEYNDNLDGMVEVSPVLEFMTPTLPEALQTGYNTFVYQNHKAEPEMISIPKDEYVRLVAAAKTIIDQERWLHLSGVEAQPSRTLDTVTITTSKYLPDDKIWEWIESQEIVTIESFVRQQGSIGVMSLKLTFAHTMNDAYEYAEVNNMLLADFNGYFN